MTPPATTSAPDSATPTCSKVPMIRAKRSSLQPPEVALTLDPPCQAVVEHLQCQSRNHQTKNDAKRARPKPRQQTGPKERPQQDSKHYRHSKTGVNVTALQINSGAGRRRHANHEVARRSRYLERNAHGLVHG